MIEDAVNDLSVVNKAITPRKVQEYVAGNVHLNVELGYCLQPALKDLDEALEWSRLKARCAFESLKHGSHPRM